MLGSAGGRVNMRVGGNGEGGRAASDTPRMLASTEATVGSGGVMCRDPV
jgi:hypothetical protein